MATRNDDDSSTSLVEIAPEGDVILIVGQDKRTIQVSSSILKNGSRYFRNMFGPHFSEGQNLSAASPKEISMPEDNALAMEVICNILHLRNDDVPEALGPLEVFDVAVAADKFECVVALKHASALWLKCKETQGIPELGHLMAAAYILDDARSFSEITLAMVLRHEGRFLSISEEDFGLDDSILWQIIYLLEERRNQIRTELQNIILDGSKDSGIEESTGCTCGWSSRYTAAYLHLLQKEELWPLQMVQTPISRVLYKLENMGDPAVGREWAPCSYRWHTTPHWRSSRNWRLENFKKNNGLCLDCIRSWNTGTKRACRVQHGNH